MVERCELCGTTVGCHERQLAGDYIVMACRMCINRSAANMYDMPEFREWLVTDRALNNMVGQSAADIWIRVDMHLKALKRLHEALDLLWMTARAHTPAVPKLKPPVMPPDPEESKPATVYALAYKRWFSINDYPKSEVKLHGVYATKRAMETAKAKIMADDYHKAHAENKIPSSFTWRTWEGSPME